MSVDYDVKNYLKLIYDYTDFINELAEHTMFRFAESHQQKQIARVNEIIKEARGKVKVYLYSHHNAPMHLLERVYAGSKIPEEDKTDLTKERNEIEEAFYEVLKPVKASTIKDSMYGTQMVFNRTQEVVSELNRKLQDSDQMLRLSYNDVRQMHRNAYLLMIETLADLSIEVNKTYTLLTTFEKIIKN